MTLLATSQTLLRCLLTPSSLFERAWNRVLKPDPFAVPTSSIDLTKLCQSNCVSPVETAFMNGRMIVAVSRRSLARRPIVTSALVLTLERELAVDAN